MTRQLDLRSIGDEKEQFLAALRLSRQGSVGWLVPTQARIRRYQESLPQGVTIATKADKFPENLSALIDQGLARRYYQLPGGAVVSRIVNEARYQEVLTKQQANNKPLVVYLASPQTDLPKGDLEVKTRGQSATGNSLASAIIATWENFIFQYGDTLEMWKNYREYYAAWAGDDDMKSVQRLADLIVKVSMVDTAKNSPVSPLNVLAAKTWAAQVKLDPAKIAEIIRYYNWSLRSVRQVQTETKLPIATINLVSGVARLSVTPLHVNLPQWPTSVLPLVKRKQAGEEVIDLGIPVYSKEVSQILKSEENI